MDASSHGDNGVSEALAVMKRVAAGDFEARITHITADGELGELLNTVNDLIDRCDAYVRESAACMEHVSQNKYYRKIIETSMQGAFLNASRTVNAALSTMQSKVIDFRVLTDGFERTVGDVVGTVSSAATELSSSSEMLSELAQGTSEKAASVSAAAEEASTNLQTVAASAEELTASISEISQQVGFAAMQAKEASSVSEDVSSRVVQLEDATNQISKVVELINAIAGQTNLLALNATIEAAVPGKPAKALLSSLLK